MSTPKPPKSKDAGFLSVWKVPYTFYALVYGYKTSKVMVSSDAGKGDLAIKSKVQASWNAAVSLSDYGLGFYRKAVLLLYTTNPI